MHGAPGKSAFASPAATGRGRAALRNRPRACVAARSHQQPARRGGHRAARILALCGAGVAKLTLYTSTQVPHHIRRLVAEQLGIAESSMRVISPDVGGGFGYKGKLYPEEAIWPGRRAGYIGQCAGRRRGAESFLADNQGRDHVTNAELALDADGHFLALRVSTLANLGAYVSTFGAAIPSAIYTSLLAGVYRTPAIFVESTGVFTNTTADRCLSRRR